MPFNFQQFLSARSDSTMQRQLDQLPDFARDLRHCLVTGPAHSGRTALLFHYAHSRAAAGEDVLFVTRRQSVEFEPPVLPAGVSKDDLAFECIRMRYLETLMDVKKLAASIHLLEKPPAAIVVDDLSSFQHAMPADRQHHDSQLIATLGYLHDATQWAGTVREDKDCALVVSEVASTEGPHLLFVYQRWCPLVLQITVVAEGPRLMLAPVVLDHHDIDPATCVGLDFSVSKHSTLTLDNIVRLA